MEPDGNTGDLKHEFLRAQLMTIDFENCVNNEEKYFKQAVTLFEKLVVQIQRDSTFSPNEEIHEIDPHHLPYLMIPYFHADTMFRFMEDRKGKI